MADAALYRQIVDMLLAEHEKSTPRPATSRRPGIWPSPGACAARCTACPATPCCWPRALDRVVPDPVSCAGGRDSRPVRR